MKGRNRGRGSVLPRRRIDEERQFDDEEWRGATKEGDGGRERECVCVKKDRRGEGEKGDPRCASYVCARTAQRDSKPPSIRPRDKCVPRRETKRRDDSSSFVKPFSGTNGDDNGEGRRRGRPLREFETNEISGVKDTSFLHSFFGAASLLKRSTCREGHSSRLVAFRNLPKEISNVGDAERSRGQNIISAFRPFSVCRLVHCTMAFARSPFS